MCTWLGRRHGSDVRSNRFLFVPDHFNTRGNNAFDEHILDVSCMKQYREVFSKTEYGMHISQSFSSINS